MPRVGVIFFFLVPLFFLEFALNRFWGMLLTPDFSILLIVFFSLYWGIRYSLITAVLAGILKDSFATNGFGMHLFSYVVCAYLTTILIKYIYQRGSRELRVILVVVMTFIQGIMHFLLLNVFADVSLGESLLVAIIPGALVNALVANFVFDRMKLCVSKLSV